MDDSTELDYIKWWGDSFNPALVNNATTVATPDLVYLCPFEMIDLTQWRTLKFKFSYAGLGRSWGFTFRVGIFKMMRGTGGTANTYSMVQLLGVSNVAPPIAATGTYYFLLTTTAITNHPFESGTYALGMQWDDTSGVGSSIAITAYGTLLTSNDYWFYDGGSSAGSMPTTINTVGSAQLFQPYWEQH